MDMPTYRDGWIFHELDFEVCRVVCPVTNAVDHDAQQREVRNV
jgi:hypothetical protein